MSVAFERGLAVRPIVGRAAEQRLVRAAVDRVAGGAGAIVLLSGESGIGKTRLARHALACASERGFAILEGTSNPLNRELPYGPLVEALGRSLRGFDAAERGRLTAGFPVLGRLVVGLDLPDPEPLGDPGLEKMRLFEAVLRLLDRVSRRAPIALLLDDLQWFDPASLELLAYLTRDLAGLQILVIATYRSQSGTELDPPLRLLLRSLRRTGISEELMLAPLARDELSQLAQELLGAACPPRVVELVAERSGGIPLFAEILIGALRDQQSLAGGDAGWLAADKPWPRLPAEIRDVVLERLERLAGAERRVLDLVAVGGDDVPHAVLSELADVEDLDTALARLIASGLLAERSGTDPGYVFTSPLVLETAYGDAAVPGRRLLHARFATVWERRAPDDLDRLAFHYQRALPHVPVGRVLEVSLAAAQRALGRYANSDAARHYEAALGLAAEGGAPGTAGILMGLGEARLRLGELEAARAAWDDAVFELERAGAHRRAAQLHRRIAEALADWGDLGRSARHVEAGLACLAAVPPCEDHVALHLVSLYAAHQAAEPAAAEAAAHRVARIALQVGTGRARAMAALAAGIAAGQQGDFDTIERVMVPAQHDLADVDVRFAVRRHGLPTMLAALRGDLPALRDGNRRTQDAARRIGVPATVYRLFLFQFVEAFYAGDWERAGEVLREAELAADTVDHPRIGAVAAVIGVVLRAFQADFDEAERTLHALADRTDRGVLPQRQGSKLHAILSALLSVERADPASALEQIARTSSDYLPMLLPLPWAWAARGEAEAKTGQTAAALETVRILDALGPPGSYPAAMAARIDGLAEAAAGRAGAAIERLSNAAAAFERLGMPFEATRAGIEAAEVAVRERLITGELAEMAGRWYRTTARLRAERYAGRARRLLHALGEPVPVGSPEDRVLTPRQLEVAELVARGLSNAEVADELFLSVRTVTTHLDRIYTRLGINSRAALATYVTELRHREDT